jgi:DNA-binding MarR family transcriptional regulator
MHVDLPSKTVFHSIERAIKEYRKFAQKRLSNEVEGITIDQGMILVFMNKYPDYTQKEIAALAFRDNASMTRMVNLMVEKKYLKRSIHKSNRRRFKVEVTAKGKGILDSLRPIVFENRKQALTGITKEELEHLDVILKKITANCSES